MKDCKSGVNFDTVFLKSGTSKVWIDFLVFGLILDDLIFFVLLRLELIWGTI